jgi:arabinogalactan endo-1,4-beta-galactosidase
MKISAAFPSKYLKACDLQDRNFSVIMSTVELEDVGDSDRKPVLYFQGKSKGLVLNKTNSRAIAAAYGDDTDDWRGKSLVLFPAMVDFRGDTVEAIRVRAPKQVSSSPANKLNEANPPPQQTIPEGGHLDDEIPF